MKQNNPFAVVPKAQVLNDADQRFLVEHEKIIGGGLQKFREVGTALLEIRDYNNGVLFKEGFGSFERYCQERWDIGQSQAYRLMGEAKIVNKISPMGENESVPMPTTGRQIRPLTLLKKPADQFKAWKTVVDENRPDEITGELVRKAVLAQLANGAERASKERKTAKGKVVAKPEAKKNPEGQSHEKIKGKLAEIRKLAKGNKAITGLVAEIEVLLSEK